MADKPIGSFIDASEADSAQAKASADAAIAADQKAVDDKAKSEHTDETLVDALAQTGPITVQNNDGTFSTYEASTSSAGPKLVERASKGRDTVVSVPDEPAPPEPAPPVDPNAPPVDPNAPVDPLNPDQPVVEPPNPDQPTPNPDQPI